VDREHHRNRRRSHGRRNPDALQGSRIRHSYHHDDCRPHLYRGRPHGQARLRPLRSVQFARVPQAREEVRWLEEGKAFPSLQPRPRPKCQARLRAGFSLFPSRVFRYPSSGCSDAAPATPGFSIYKLL